MADVRAPTAKRTAPPLSGALGTVSLPDVLQLLELGRRSGVLAVDGGDGRRGVVHLADGAIARAHYRDARPRGGAAATAPAVDELTAAVGALLALRAGRFTFTPAADPPAPGPRARVEAVLLAALHAADESDHRQTRGAVDATPGEPTAVTHPEPRRIPVLAPTRADVPGPQLRARHWAVLAAVDGVRDPRGVAAACGRDPAAVHAVLGELVTAGMVAFR